MLSRVDLAGAAILHTRREREKNFKGLEFYTKGDFENNSVCVCCGGVSNSPLHTLELSCKAWMLVKWCSCQRVLCGIDVAVYSAAKVGTLGALVARHKLTCSQ